jgi:hypothetical protein
MNVTASTDAAMAAIFNQSPKDAVDIDVMKKAPDTEMQSTQTLPNAVPQPVKGASNLPPNLGQNVNTTA